MPDNPTTDGQTWTCQTPNWPDEKCDNAKPSFRKNGGCMYLHKDQDNRCDCIKNTEKQQNGNIRQAKFRCAIIKRAEMPLVGHPNTANGL